METKQTLLNLIQNNKLLADQLLEVHKETEFVRKENEIRMHELLAVNKNLSSAIDESHLEISNLLTEKEKRAAELIIANKELVFQNSEKEKRAAELEVINKELEQFAFANAELKQFAYIASHELKEPLRTISNFLQIFEEDYINQLNDKAVEYLHVMNSATSRMTILINSLLHFSRLGSNKQLVKADVNKLITDVVADLDDLIKRSNAIIEVSEMPALYVYEVELQEVFQNLITNAIKFVKNNNQPKIQIQSKKINGNWKFSVIDNGIGIVTENTERVFDIFQRLHLDETVYEGSGIGLAYCKKIIQLHKGRIWFESNITEGTTFHFTIPNLQV